MQSIENRIPKAETKRTIVQPEAWARERVRAIAAASRELQSSNPDFVGLVLFGSLIKGASRDIIDEDPSDIDAIGFVEIAEAQLTTIKRSTQEEEYCATIYPAYSTNPKLLDKHRSTLRLAIERHAHVPHEITSDCRVLPLNPTLVARLVAETCEVCSLQQIHGTQKIYMGSIPQQLESIFHIGVGGTKHLDTYRQQILSLLVEQGELGTTLWKEIVNGIQLFENSEYKGFPQTPAEALIYFGLSDI
jgi:hypothetical protein